MHRFAVAGTLIVASAQAGVIRPLTIDEVAAAPHVVVCRVEKIALGPFVAAAKGARPAAVRHCTAKLRVLRAFPDFKAERIYLDHYCHGSNFAMANGHPAYAGLEPGRTYVFPLVPHGDGWKLLADEGYGLVVPVIDANPSGNPPSSKREFIFREIVNSLLHGDYPDLFRFSGYLQFRHARELNDEIMAALAAALPPGDPRWLDISTALLATEPTRLSDLAASGPPRDFFPDAVQALAARTLQEVPIERRREGILRNMLQHSALHPQTADTILMSEFKDDPLLVQLLPAYLARQQKGAVAIACSLAGEGQLALRDLTFAAALRVLRDRTADYTDTQGALGLLIHHGSDEQFEEYLVIMKEAKVHDRSRYRQMWEPAWEDKSPRILPILAVILDDPRGVSPWDDVRTCDFGGALLERHSGQKFGYKQWDKMPLPERNAALARARAWMKQALNSASSAPGPHSAASLPARR
jgi:hypothetical protein